MVIADEWKLVKVNYGIFAALIKRVRDSTSKVGVFLVVQYLNWLKLILLIP
jgi:hypothetical protein